MAPCSLRSLVAFDGRALQENASVGQTRCDCTSLDNSLVAGRIIYGTLHCVRLLRAWAKHPSCGSSSFVLIQGENR
jgi:hypothetical protein